MLLALDAASWANITLATGTVALAAVTLVLAKRAKRTAESGLELERRFIERTDFPAARRGYERVEVDHHLRQVADWVEELKRSAPASDSSSVAAAAAEQVRGIVDAAERSAAEIRSKAEREAEEARRSAGREATETRQRAGVEAAAHVQRVEETTAQLLERARAIESELDRLVGDLSGSIRSVVATVRDGAGSLSTRLEQMRNELSQVCAGTIAHGEPAGVGPADAAPDVGAEGQETTAEATYKAPRDEAGTGELEPAPEPSEAVEPEPAQEPAAGAGGAAPFDFERVARDQPAAARGGGVEGARLIALNMALNGSPRADTGRFLNENFDLDDPEAILEEVYARAGG
jgi:cell division septum initiation protein DivIVA